MITAIINARAQGKRKGDSPHEPLELIVRGYSKDDEYYEDHALRIPLNDEVTEIEIETALRGALDKIDRESEDADT